MSRDKLAAIERLQKIDLDIEELTKTTERFPARRAELEAEAGKARSGADVERGRLADNERARRGIQNVLDQEQDKVKKWEQRLPQLKHPREFAALQREVENAKKANIQAEEDLKRLEGEGVEVKAALRAKEAELAAKESVFARENKTMQSQESELREKIGKLAATVEELKAACDPVLLRAYHDIRRRRPGKALVPVLGGSCSACNRRQPPQLMNKLHAGSIEPCPSCSRLIYLPPTPAGQG